MAGVQQVHRDCPGKYQDHWPTHTTQILGPLRRNFMKSDFVPMVGTNQLANGTGAQPVEGAQRPQPKCHLFWL